MISFMMIAVAVLVFGICTFAIGYALGKMESGAESLGDFVDD